MTNTPHISTTDPAEITRLACGTKVDTGEGIVLVVNQREGIDGDPIHDTWTSCEVATLTQDGRRYDRTQGWDTGRDSDDDEWVFVERWNPTGRIFHGWISKRSRRLVQAG